MSYSHIYLAWQSHPEDLLQVLQHTFYEYTEDYKVRHIDLWSHYNMPTNIHKKTIIIIILITSIST